MGRERECVRERKGKLDRDGREREGGGGKLDRDGQRERRRDITEK